MAGVVSEGGQGWLLGIDGGDGHRDFVSIFWWCE
jgi:hypothetical protein